MTLRQLSAFIGLFGLTACGQTIYKDRVQTVKVPVNQPCVGERPAEVLPLKQRYTDAEWNALDARQKAAIVGKQGLDRQAYGERLNAATGACE